MRLPVPPLVQCSACRPTRTDAGDDRAVVDLAADLSWQIGGTYISPLVMTPDEFARWKATERRTPLAIDREGVDL